MRSASHPLLQLADSVIRSLVIVGSSLLIRDTGSASALVFKRGAQKTTDDKLDRIASKRQHDQAERVLSREINAERVEKEPVSKDFSKAPVFTFENVRYTVQVGGKDSESVPP